MVEANRGDAVCSRRPRNRNIVTQVKPTVVKGPSQSDRIAVDRSDGVGSRRKLLRCGSWNPAEPQRDCPYDLIRKGIITRHGTLLEFKEKNGPSPLCVVTVERPDTLRNSLLKVTNS